MYVETAEHQAAEFASRVPRPDLSWLDGGDGNGAPGGGSPGPGGPPGGPDYLYGHCTASVEVGVPVFEFDEAAGATSARVEAQRAPVLDPVTIARVKRRAMAAAPRRARAAYNGLIARASRRTAEGFAAGAARREARAAAAAVAAADAAAGGLELQPADAAAAPASFLHPGGYAGPGELALLGARLAAGVQPQAAANESLITVRRARAAGGPAPRGRLRAARAAGGLAPPERRAARGARRAAATPTASPRRPPRPPRPAGRRRAAQGVQERLVPGAGHPGRRLRRALSHGKVRGRLWWGGGARGRARSASRLNSCVCSSNGSKAMAAQWRGLARRPRRRPAQGRAERQGAAHARPLPPPALGAGSWVVDNSTCPPNYPAAAPTYICGHVALIEVDARGGWRFGGAAPGVSMILIACCAHGARRRPT